MNRIISSLGIVLLTCIVFFNLAGARRSDLPLPEGPYLGQKPPGLIPEVFAPGFISTEKRELNSVFSLDGEEFYYAVYTPEPVGDYTIWYTKMVDGIWIKPEIPSFCSEYTDVDMSFSPDGKRIYFCSRRPVPGNPKPEYYIWYSNRLKDQSWSEPVMMDFPVNTPFSETYPTFTKTGRMYVASNRAGSIGSKDVYSIDYVDGKYTNAVNLGVSINTEYGEGDTFISPDESYMIVSCWGRPEGKGMDISFKREDNSWTPKKNIEKTLNWNIVGGCPYVSPDGKYFFFTSNGDIYWVSSEIIEKMKSLVMESAYDDGDIKTGLDVFWAEMSRSVNEGNFVHLTAAYHPDAVLVNGPGEISYPVSKAFNKWEQGLKDTKMGKMTASVGFRFTRRLHDEHTAHETGIFHYTANPEEGKPTDVYIHFEALLVRRDGWKIMMEYQKGPATEGEWAAAE